MATAFRSCASRPISKRATRTSSTRRSATSRTALNDDTQYEPRSCLTSLTVLARLLRQLPLRRGCRLSKADRRSASAEGVADFLSALALRGAVAVFIGRAVLRKQEPHC